jgi:arylsulfatase A-like enzyme
MLSRRDFATTLAAGKLLRAQRRERPNILLFLSDQESALLPGPARLPNRRRLFERGVRFSNAFCNTPQCSPARASLLTGLHPHEAGVLTNVDASSLGKPLPAAKASLGQVFRQAGYDTAYFGKWHLSNQSRGLSDYGFESYTPGGDAEVSRAAAEWIRGRKSPWLAVVSLLNPHDIYQIPKRAGQVRLRDRVRPPASGLENLDAKPSEQRWFADRDQGAQTRHFTREDWLRYRSFYLELVEMVDGHLGEVLDALDIESTVVTYTSDHGDTLGEHGLAYKGPFMYEPLIRIPLVISAPGILPPGRIRQDMATLADVAPTLASMAGLSWPGKVSGRDLARDDRGPDAVLLEYYAKQKHVNPIRCIRTRHWKLNLYDRGNRELYDLAEDPNELRNLAGVPAYERVERDLERRLDAWRKPLT